MGLTCALATALGCWSGEGSRGLPCEEQLHCGLGLECISGYCGGEPSATLCGNGFLDPGEACDAGEQNADDAACRLDCTPETCGDGVQGPTELCDDGNTNPGDGCSPACMPETGCGNAVVDPGEDCDDAGESATCNDDCTSSMCGDNKRNEAAGEECDDDDDPLCLDNCTVPLLWDDMEVDTPTVAWTHELVSGGPVVTDTWAVTGRNAKGRRSWDTGLPPDGAGDTRLMTPTIDLSPFVGQAIELRFDHTHTFRDCNLPTSYEGAVVEVSVDDGPYQVIAPTDGYSPEVVGDGLCTDNPLDGQQVFTDDIAYLKETFDLSAFAGSSIKVGFRVGWDCGNCPTDQTGRGWFIDNVMISRN
ncbi:Multiple EGF-like-domain protein 3 precursor [Enhygromyxa salina]|uniref:Multiple EGF-like-domain protein 3 n=1 Tax=Enhygromyxa salina TaxID=215803 RepID=A0A0C1ZJK8_9BACT|nr:DUF4215 domain-containing protein [Enhygromyxa salina]KIG17664.1 Multiple EGF-like-domain protein 3 precursor [Enhygromyxa salina]